MLVIVNPSSGGGTGLKTWRRIAPAVRDRSGPFETEIVRDPGDVEAVVSKWLAAGETRFVAAGGDGTVNMVAAALVNRLAPRELRDVCLGAIGLGSSNDFHKPGDPSHRVAGVPVRLDFEHSARHDVGLVEFLDDVGRSGRRPWLINSSIGTTAEANGFFNRPDALLRLLKRRSTGLAIAYAALHTILRSRSTDLSMSIDGEPVSRLRIANLGVVKNPHFTGSLRYDSPHEPDSGRFFVHTLAELSLPRLLLALARLARGRFSGQPGASSRRASRLEVRADRPFAVEGDGEVVFATEASFSVMPRLLRVCA